MKSLINSLVKLLVKWCLKRGRVFYITGGPANKTVYLVRYILFKSKYGCVYIHRFMRSDSDDPHDHPWNFFTYVISGSYQEKFFDKNKITHDGEKFLTFWTTRINTRLAGSIAYRKATDIHQVLVDRSRDMDEVESAPFTICLMGPRIRDWGFWPLKMDGSNFVDWRKYLNIKPADPRTEGSE